jgi:hypothetical protein
MVLGAILSLNHQLLNVTAYDTSAFLVPNASSTSSSNLTEPPASREVVPVFELVLGTITYLVSVCFHFFTKLFPNDVSPRMFTRVN